MVAKAKRNNQFGNEITKIIFFFCTLTMVANGEMKPDGNNHVNWYAYTGT